MRLTAGCAFESPPRNMSTAVAETVKAGLDDVSSLGKLSRRHHLGWTEQPGYRAKLHASPLEACALTCSALRSNERPTAAPLPS